MLIKNYREKKSSSSEKSNSPKKKLHKTSSASSSGEFPLASTPTASSSYQNIHSPSVNSSSNHKKSLSKSHSSPHPSSQSRKYHPTAGTELPSDLSRESTEIAQEPQKLEKKSKKRQEIKEIEFEKNSWRRRFVQTKIERFKFGRFYYEWVWCCEYAGEERLCGRNIEDNWGRFSVEWCERYFEKGEEEEGEKR